MKKVIAFTIFCFLFPFIGCEVEEIQTNNHTGENEEKITINEAKLWFESHFEHKQNLRVNGDLNSKTPKWESAYKSFRYNNGDAVVVPINYEKNYSRKFYLDKNKQKKEKGKEPLVPAPINDLDKLVIYKDLKGNLHEELLQIIPDQDYLDDKVKNKKTRLFDGLITVNDWSENLQKAFIFKNGKLISKGSPQKSSVKNGRISEISCNTYFDCSEQEYWQCYYSGSNPPFCYLWFTFTTCNYWEECTTYPDNIDQFYIEFVNYTNNNINSPGQKPLAEYSPQDKCSGLSNMWNSGVSANKEANGVLTKDGNLLFTQLSNTVSGGSFSGIYEQSGTTYYYYPADGNVPTYTGTVSSGGRYFIPIIATIHTHTPCVNDGTDGITNNDGGDDFPFALRFNSIKHYVIGCGKVAEFDDTHYFNYHSGNLSNTCTNIQ